MEAILDKKPPKMTGRWSPRLFRLRDRHLMYFRKDNFNFGAVDSAAKFNLDLTHLISLSILKKHKNVLVIKHPVLDIAIKFKNDKRFIAWLRALSAFTHNEHLNGPKIESVIPSNFAFAIWNILQSLYQNANTIKSEGIFRISADKKEKKKIFDALLEQKYDLNELKNCANVHILANILCSLLSNLPSTIFKERQIEKLILFFDDISQQKQSSKMDLFHSNHDNKSSEHVDDKVANISIDILKKLKTKIEEIYCLNEENEQRYGLMTLIFHLLKQIILNEAETKMTAEALSRIFVDILESRIHLNSCSDPMAMFRMKWLIQTLIYNAYYIFPEQEWLMKDIVIVHKCEHAMIRLYHQFEAMRNGKNKQKKWFKSKRLRKHKKNASVQLPQIFYSKQQEKQQQNEQKFVSRFKQPAARNSDLVSIINKAKKSNKLSPKSPVLMNQMSTPVRGSVTSKEQKKQKLSVHYFDEAESDEDGDEVQIDYDDYKDDIVIGPVPKRDDLNRKRSRSQPPGFDATSSGNDDDPVTPFDVGDFHPVLLDDEEQKQRKSLYDDHGHNKIITTMSMKAECATLDFHHQLIDFEDVNDKELELQKPKLEEMKTNEWMESVFEEIVADQDG